jgi:hypothetical protein
VPYVNLFVTWYYTFNHLMNERLEVIEAEQVEWGEWGRAHGFIGDA